MNGLRSREGTGEILKNLAFLSRNGHHRELKEYIGSVVPEACLTLDGPVDREALWD